MRIEIPTDVEYNTTLNHRDINPSAFVVLGLQSDSVLNQKVKECAGITMLVNTIHETILGFLAHFRCAGEIVPEDGGELRIIGEIVFEDAVGHAKVLRKVFSEHEDELAHVLEEDFDQMPEAGNVFFSRPLIRAYRMLS
jgi:hypothetical protein